MTFLVIDPFSTEHFLFENRTEAETKAQEIYINSVIREEYRFSVAKEIINGNDTIWMKADLENDLENYNYYVFNTYTGEHELFNSLSSAKARNKELREQFIQTLAISVQEVVQPESSGTQTL